MTHTEPTSSCPCRCPLQRGGHEVPHTRCVCVFGGGVSKEVQGGVWGTCDHSCSCSLHACIHTHSSLTRPPAGCPPCCCPGTPPTFPTGTEEHRMREAGVVGGGTTMMGAGGGHHTGTHMGGTCSLRGRGGSGVGVCFKGIHSMLGSTRAGDA